MANQTFLQTKSQMRYLGVALVLTTSAFAAANCGPGAGDFPSGCSDRTVVLIVEPMLTPLIRTELSRFEGDLCTGGYNTIEHTAGFSDPAAIRTYLQGLREEPHRKLAGAILIGDIPHAYQWVIAHSTNPDIPETEEEVISFQYYADLDGTFAKSAAYTSPGGHSHSYDLHSGPVNWEIWIGVLPRYKGSLPQSVAAINRYFAKNHAFRIRELMRPEVFLQINEHKHAATMAEHNTIYNDMRSGVYSWTPWSNAAGARLYFDSLPGGLTTGQGYTDMLNGAADFTVTDTHGNWGASGELTIETVETSDVQTLFFWSNGCAIGDLDHADNFLSSVLYSSTSDALIAKGTTNDSGGMGNNSNGFFGHNIAASLSARKAFGDAILDHVNVPLIAPWSGDREFHFATAVVLGDPTLRRSHDWWGQPSYSFDCTSRPKGTVCVSYEDGYIWLVKDSVKSWEKHDNVQTAVGLSSRYEHILGTNLIRRTP